MISYRLHALTDKRHSIQVILEPTLQSGIEGGVAISGGLEKSLKVNKRGVAISGGWNKLQGECLWMGCYKWIRREDQHLH